MEKLLHITSGDCAGDILVKSGIPGEVFVWHDILYDGPRNAGIFAPGVIEKRAVFLEQTTGGGLTQEIIVKTLWNQFYKLLSADQYDRIVLWFDACLFDQSMLAHILTFLNHIDYRHVELLCIDAYPGIEPYHGLGQLNPEEMASVYDQRKPVTDEQFKFAILVDIAFAKQDIEWITDLAQRKEAPLPWVPAAAARWLQEQPDPVTGLGRLEQLAMDAIRSGLETPPEIYRYASAHDTPPQFWGDTTLWMKINHLADREPAIVQISGPAKRLPQWESSLDLNDFRIRPLTGSKDHFPDPSPDGE